VDIAYVAIVDSINEAKLLLDANEDYYYYGTSFSSTPEKNGGPVEEPEPEPEPEPDPEPDTCTEHTPVVSISGNTQTVTCSVCNATLRNFTIPESINWYSVHADATDYQLKLTKLQYDPNGNVIYNSYAKETNKAGHIQITGGSSGGAATADKFEVGKYIVIKYRGSNTSLTLQVGSSKSAMKSLGEQKAANLPENEWRVAVVSLENVTFTTDDDGKSTLFVRLDTYGSNDYIVDIAYAAMVDSIDEVKLLLEDGEDYYYYGTKFSSTPVKNGGAE
jgi:hypothetical protein